MCSSFFVSLMSLYCHHLLSPGASLPQKPVHAWETERAIEGCKYVGEICTLHQHLFCLQTLQSKLFQQITDMFLFTDDTITENLSCACHTVPGTVGLQSVWNNCTLMACMAYEITFFQRNPFYKIEIQYLMSYKTATTATAVGTYQVQGSYILLCILEV